MKHHRCHTGAKHTDSLDPAMGWSGIEALRRKIRRFRIWKISEVHTQDGFSTKFHSDASRSITDHHNHTITTQRQHKLASQPLEKTHPRSPV